MQKRLSSHTKGQLALENLILFAMVFFGLIALWYSSSAAITGSYVGNQLSSNLAAIKNAADDVHNLGMGSRSTVRIDMPGGVMSAAVSGKEINIAGGDGQTYNQRFEYNVVGSLPSAEGQYNIPVTAVTPNTVKIGSAPFLWRAIPPCMGARSRTTIELRGEDLANALLYVKEPQSHGGQTYAYPPTNYTVLGQQKISVIVSINLTHPSSQYIFWYAHAQNDPYYFIAEQGGTGWQSNPVSFYMTQNCAFIPP